MSDQPEKPLFVLVEEWARTLEEFRLASRIGPLFEGKLNLRGTFMSAEEQSNTDARRALVEDITLGQMAYTAYATATEWKNFQGAEMPDWYELTEAIRRAWILAAKAVRNWSTVDVDDV